MAPGHCGPGAGSGTGMPANIFAFSDPFGLPLRYNDPWRRSCEMARLLWGDPCPFTKANGAH